MNIFYRFCWLVSVCGLLSFVHARDILPAPFEEEPVPEILLVLEDIRPMGGGHQGHVYLRLILDEDSPRAEAFADYNEKSRNRVDAISFTRRNAEIEGEFRIEIGPDGARRGRAHFPTPPDVFRVEVKARLDANAYAAQRGDREAFMPYWRKDTPMVAGWAVKGAYQGEWQRGGESEPRDVKGAISGSWRLRGLGGGWRAQGPALLEPAEGGLILNAFLPEQKRVDGNAAWARVDFKQPILLRGGGVRLSLGPLSPDAKVDMVDVSLAARTERGWFSTMDRVRVGKTAAVESVEIPFSEFGDRWRPFAGDELHALRVGVVNGEGIGRVGFPLTALSVMEGDEEAGDPKPVRIVLRPSVVRSFNGVDRVPEGLFGFHVVGNKLKSAKPGEDPPLEMMRTIRPGMLRPLTHTGFGGGHGVGKTVRELAEAGGAEERVVWTHTMDLWARPPWMDRGMAPLLKKVESFYADMAGRAWTPEHPDRLLRYFEVWNEPFMWGRHINMGFRLPKGKKDVRDDTQYGYIPGKVGADAWSGIFAAAVKGAKAVNPHVRLGGPSAPDIGSYDYADFRNYTLRIIESVGDRMDFFTEHHYGGNPLLMGAGYEVVRAAFWRLHGRTVPILNTEANDLGASDAGKALYNLTEILHLIDTQPDLARGRALHALWNGRLRSSGERDAWRMMAPLRGRILDVTVDGERMTAVASHPESGKAVLVGADHGFGDVPVRISLPEGFRVEELMLLMTETPAKELRLRDVDGAAMPEIPEGKTERVRVAPRVETGVVSFSMPERSAFRLTVVKDGFEPHRVRDRRFQPMDLLFRELAPGQTLSLSPPTREIDPDRLFLRTVLAGEALVRWGDETLEIPVQAHRPGEAELRHIEVPPKALSQGVTLQAGPRGATVLTAGWVWEN